MHLGKLYSNFDSRCKSYSVRINELINKQTSISGWEHNYLTEVLISDIWQSWTNFCRELFLSSCRGTVARDGSIITMRSGDLSWKRLGYEVKQALNNKNCTSHGHNGFYIRHEPTWGDIDKFINIVQSIPPSNCNRLISIYGSFTDLKHLQQVRNACAHKNVETIKDISLLSTVYNFHKLKYATDLAWKNKYNQSEFAIELWLFEMNLIADFATSGA